MAKRAGAYKSEKRKKELMRQKKQEEKRKRRLYKPDGTQMTAEEAALAEVTGEDVTGQTPAEPETKE